MRGSHGPVGSQVKLGSQLKLGRKERWLAVGWRQPGWRAQRYFFSEEKGQERGKREGKGRSCHLEGSWSVVESSGSIL